MKQAITNKMFEAIHELKLRSRDSNLSNVQRMFGVVLGLRIALMEINKIEGNSPYNFAGHLGIAQLIHDGFGQMKLAQIREYAFPEF